MAGRTKLTDEIEREAARLVEAGSSVRQALLALGISDRTIARWAAQARSSPNGRYGIFWHNLQRAQARFVVHAAERLAESLEEKADWRGWLEVVRRRDPDAWEPESRARVRQEIAADVNAHVTQEPPREFLATLTDDELSALEKISAKLARWKEERMGSDDGENRRE